VVSLNELYCRSMNFHVVTYKNKAHSVLHPFIQLPSVNCNSQSIRTQREQYIAAVGMSYSPYVRVHGNEFQMKNYFVAEKSSHTVSRFRPPYCIRMQKRVSLAYVCGLQNPKEIFKPFAFK